MLMLFRKRKFFLTETPTGNHLLQQLHLTAQQANFIKLNFKMQTQTNTKKNSLNRLFVHTMDEKQQK